jgi:predicted lipid carrier protein YhbT
MKQRLFELFFSVLLQLISLKPGLRKELRTWDGESIALRIGSFQPIVLQIRKGKLMRDGETSSNVEIITSLKTLWAIFRGKLDLDAAFFLRQISLRGSLVGAMRFKVILDYLIK